MQNIAAGLLRAAGVLLIALGLVHLVATPHIPALLHGCPAAVYGRAVGPTLLNHVLVGILLLPLGYATWLAAGRQERGKVWAKRVLIANTLVMLTLPASLVVFMRRAEYFTSPLFLIGVGLVAVVSLLMAVATFIVSRVPSPSGE